MDDKDKVVTEVWLEVKSNDPHVTALLKHADEIEPGTAERHLAQVSILNVLMAMETSNAIRKARDEAHREGYLRGSDAMFDEAYSGNWLQRVWRAVRS